MRRDRSHRPQPVRRLAAPVLAVAFAAALAGCGSVPAEWIPELLKSSSVPAGSPGAGGSSAATAGAMSPAPAGTTGSSGRASSTGGRLVIDAWPQVRIDGRPFRAAPGARIVNGDGLTITPDRVTPGTPVRMEFDAQGDIRLLRIVDPSQAGTPRGNPDRQ